jgi:hypothetical protein
VSTARYQDCREETFLRIELAVSNLPHFANCLALMLDLNRLSNKNLVCTAIDYGLLGNSKTCGDLSAFTVTSRGRK